MRKGLNLILPISLLLTSCQSSIQDQIIGKWMMESVIQGKKDVTADHNPVEDRYIIFSQDFTFESGGNPYGLNTGKYSIDDNNMTLFLDSDAGPEDDSSWIFAFEEDTMKWNGQGSPWAEDFKLVHVRVKE